MPKPELGKVAVGDRLLVIERHHAHQHAGLIEVEVTKVARVWIDLKQVNGQRTWRMRLDSQTDGSDFGYPPRFVTRDQHEHEQRIDAAEAVLSGAKVRPDFGSLWRHENRLLALADFIRTYDEQHPHDRQQHLPGARPDRP